MKLIKPSYKILTQGPGLQGIYEQIELAGRTCYKSSPKIEEVAHVDLKSFPEGVTVDVLPSFKEHPEEFKQKVNELNLKVDYIKINTSAKDFVDRMIASKHLSMLEHATVYLDISLNIIGDFGKYLDNSYSKVTINRGHVYVSTNMRVLQENGWLDDFKYLCEPTEFHEKRVTVRFTSNIHFYKDLTRHRKMSYAIESTRYCNYSKNKFNNGLTFILPAWCDTMEEGDYGTLGHQLVRNRGHKDGTFSSFVEHLYRVEKDYLYLIECGWQAQQAAEVLPQATKADIVCTGFVSDWDYIFKLRTSIIAATGQPHPEVSRLMDPLYKEFKERNYI